MEPAIEDTAVKNFREYLRIKTCHPNPEYEHAICWLEKQAKELDLKFNLLRFPNPGQFTVWMTWEGQDSSLSSILLNSHIDVVAVDYRKWSKDPFGAEKDEKGNIYGRGSQDMKCVGIQYMEAIRNLQAKGHQPLRTVHVSFVPDEELGGFRGMGCFVKSEEFKNLNVGFAMDEGIASPDETYDIFYGERYNAPTPVLLEFTVVARGKAGHPSFVNENTAAEKINYVIDKALKLREEEKARMKKHFLHLGDVTTINLTMLSGGVQPNVICSELSAVFDMRVTPNWKLDDVFEMVRAWCQNAGSDVSYKFVQKNTNVNQTKLDEGNLWWRTFKNVCDRRNMKLNTKIFPAATDIRYLRELGIPALGFSPMNNTPILLHDIDEFLNENIFLEGVNFYQDLLEVLTCIPTN